MVKFARNKLARRQTSLYTTFKQKSRPAHNTVLHKTAIVLRTNVSKEAQKLQVKTEMRRNKQ